MATFICGVVEYAIKIVLTRPVSLVMATFKFEFILLRFV